MSKYTAKQIAESDDLFDKQIHKVRKFYLSRNPDKMMILEERKAVIKERNKGLSPEYDKEYYCGTCGAKAEATDEQIKKQAEEMAKPEVVTLKVRFYTYGVSYNPYTCVDVEIPFYDDKKIRDMLNKASADIMKWCDENMEKYNKELKESRSTKKHCEGLRKHIANLERRLLRHTLANVILSIISVATIIALFTLIQN